MSDAAPSLPPLQQALLDAATLQALFSDLALCTRLLSVHVRAPGAARGGQPDTCSLETARDGLLSGLLRSVQIRYAYENATWCDTLIAAPGGARIIRIRDEDIGLSVAQTLP